jgi:hypothetical protein
VVSRVTFPPFASIKQIWSKLSMEQVKTILPLAGFPSKVA